MDYSNLTSARAVADAAEKERKEKEIQRIERQFDKDIQQQIVNELKEQNAQLKKEYEESQIELKKSRRFNKIMLVATIVSIAIAVASLIVAIVK